MNDFPSDDELVRDCKQGDAFAQKLLIAKYQPILISFAEAFIFEAEVKSFAHDLVQETFTSFFARDIDRYSGQRLQPYLLENLRHDILDFVKGLRRYRQHVRRCPANNETRDTPLNAAMDSEAEGLCRSLMRKAEKLLSQDDQQLIKAWIKLGKGATGRSVAREVGFSESGLRIRLFKIGVRLIDSDPAFGLCGHIRGSVLGNVWRSDVTVL